MTTYPSDTRLPPLLQWGRYARNGLPASAALMRQIGEQTDHILAYRRKAVMMKGVPVTAITAGASGGKKRFCYHVHTGEGASALEAVFVIMPAASSATQPSIYFDATDTTPTTTTSAKSYTSQINTSDVPSNIVIGRQSLAVVGDEDYYGFVWASDYARIMSCLIYEVGTVPVTSASGGVDPRYAVGGPILSSDTRAVLRELTYVWQRNAGPIIQWSCDDVDSSGVAVTATIYANILDGTTAVSASSIGSTVNLQYHNTRSQTQVPVRLWVYAGTIASGSVRVTDGSHSIEVTGITTTGWYSATGTLPAADNVKYDIQAKAASGRLQVMGVYLEEYQA